MKKSIFSFLILISGILISSAIISFADAQTTAPSDIQYPISELGNCKSQSSCKVFCDDSKNTSACLAFAEQHNLMSSEELANAKKFQANGLVGPGGCRGKDKCDAYCNDSANIDECIAFAEKNGLMSDSELKEAKKVQTAISKGIKPPACGGKKSCETYCSSSEHMEECINFSIEAGIMDSKKQEESKKVLAAIKQGIKPPACKGKDACDEYCGIHTEECMTFSLAAGMVPDDQKEQMQKTLDVLKRGIKPPACKPNPPSQSDQPDQPSQQNQNKPNQSGQGLQACDQYCAEPSHVEECVKFSVAMGNMTEQQAQMSIKNGGKGPGGCVGKEDCNTFCDNPDNQETCFNFAKENGMIPAEDLQKMQEGQQKMKDSFSSIPPEVLDCIASSLGADVVEKMKTGSVIGRKDGDSINQCFQKFGAQERRPNQNQNDQNQQNQFEQPGQDQTDQSIQPWANMCKPDENGNPTALACVDGAGKFVASAKVGSDGNPVCPTGSTAKCGNYQQQNQEGQQNQNQQGQRLPQQQPGQPNQGDTSGSGACGTGPGTCSGIGPDDINPKNGGSGQGGQQMPQQNQQQRQGQQKQQKQGQQNQGQGGNKSDPNQQGQRLPQQQPGQPNQGDTSGSGACGTGPGTCSGIGPDDINPKNGGSGQGGPNQGQGSNPSFEQNQPGQVQPQFQPQQQNLPPPPQPSSFLQEVRDTLANVFGAFWK